MILNVVLILSVLISTYSFLIHSDKEIQLQKIKVNALAVTMLEQQNDIATWCQMQNDSNCNSLAGEIISPRYFTSNENTTSDMNKQNVFISTFYQGRTITFLNPNVTNIDGVSQHSLLSALEKDQPTNMAVGVYQDGLINTLQGSIKLALPKKIGTYLMNNGLIVVIK